MIAGKFADGYPCISYAQPGAVFYACVIPARDIVFRLDIRRRSENPVVGIQRDDNPRRISEIAGYAAEPSSVFPTPIIVSASSEKVAIEGGLVKFSSDGGAIGHILDGQHRVLGLKNADVAVIDSFDLLVVFVFDIDPYAQATVFATINGNQKQVSKSLMYDLFSLYPGRSVEKTCHEIVRSLNDDMESPFYGRIKILGKKMGLADTLSQAAFVDQVGRQIRDKNGVLYGYYEKGEDWVIRKVIFNIFSALLDAQARSNGRYPEDYFFKTTGFGGVVQSLSSLVRSGYSQDDMSKDFFLRVFDVFFAIDGNPPDGVGNKAMIEIRNRLQRSLGRT